MIATYPKRKQRTDAPFKYNHKTSSTTECQYMTLQRLTFDPLSYFTWFDSVSTFAREQEVNSMLVLDHFPKDIENDEEYISAVRNSVNACNSSPELNAYVNETLLRSVDPQLGLAIGAFSLGAASENFERLKEYFSERINPFYFLSLESQLKFDITNVLQFLKDIDHLSAVYTFAFRGGAQMTPELKLQWIMNALRGNQVILLDVQCDWENIVKNPLLLRSILTKHLNNAKRIRRSLLDLM